MARYNFFTALLLLAFASVKSFTSSAAFARSSSVSTKSTKTATRMAGSSEQQEDAKSQAGSGPQFVERGVSVDQDGKSNVWAIEPKVEVETKSSEEKGSAALFAGGGLAAAAASAAVILSNLPDPNQF